MATTIFERAGQTHPELDPLFHRGTVLIEGKKKGHHTSVGGEVVQGRIRKNKIKGLGAYRLDKRQRGRVSR